MKKKKAALSMILVMCITSTSMFSFAATFSDMKDSKGKDHWSTPYVTDISNKGLVGGYSDGTFKPNKPVTRIESIVFISRLFPNETVKSVYETNKAKWEAKLNANFIPEFAKSSVVFGLENNWYTEAYLKEFMNHNNKTQREAQRYEFGVYLVRALNWEKEMSNAAVVKYKDATSIPKQAVPFIELLGKKGVIATEGNFNPLKSVTRGEVAKMLSISYPSSVRSNTTGTSPTSPKPPTTNPDGSVIMPSGTLVEGAIRIVSMDSFNTIITIQTNAGKLESYTNRSTGVIISLDGKSAQANQLREGYAVKLYTDGTTVKGIEATSVNTNVNKDITGEVVSISSNNIKIKSGSVTEEFGIATNVTITKNDKAARVLDLLPGDSITAKIQNSLVVNVTAKTQRRTLKNVVIKSVTSYSNGTAAVLIHDEQGNPYEMQITSSSQIYMNNNRVTVTSIAVGYEADVYADSNEIIDMTLYGATRSSVIAGVITEVNTRSDYFYVRKLDGKEIKVNVARNAVIVDQVTNNTKTIYDLAKNQNVIINGSEGLNSFEATRIAFY